MVPLSSLLLPILLSAVAVFIVSSIIHMVLPFHRSDFGKVPNEDAVLDALRQAAIPPGDYMMPRAASMKDMGSPEFIAKMKRGPVAHMTVIPPGPPALGGSLMLWFVYSIVVGVFAAYLTGRAMGPGAPYLEVFRFAGCVAFIGYALALPQGSIWYKRKWSTTIKVMIDGLVYGLVTGGVFGWLWP